jgi:hypothetical protein
MYNETNFIKLSHFLEATIRSATQEFPKILRIQKVHYRLHNSPTLAPILSQIVIQYKLKCHS